MKILIINENRHNSIGGIEKYTTDIANIFNKNGHNVYEYAMNLNPERIDMFEHSKYIKPLNVIQKTDKPITMKQKRLFIKKSVKEIKNIYEDYDLIINQTANIKWFKEFYKSKKVLYVQHFNPDFYLQKYIATKLLWPIIYFGMILVGIKNPFKSFQNFVVFTKEDLNKLKIKNGRVWIIPLSSFSKKEITKKNSYEKNNRLIYFGRLDNKQKKITKIVKFANKNKINIDFYGSGNTNYIKGDYCKYCGLINKNISEVLPKYKFTILLSKYEGFPFSIIESLSLGVPIITTNFCPSIEWLRKDKGFYYKKFNPNITSNEYNFLSTNAKEFSKIYLTMENFQEKWTSLIKDFE